MYCNHCGKPLTSFEGYCPYCGRPIHNTKSGSKMPLIALGLSGIGFLLSCLVTDLFYEALMLLGIVLSAYHFKQAYKTAYPKGLLNMLSFAKQGLFHQNQADRLSCMALLLCPTLFIVYCALAFLFGFYIGAGGGAL